MAVGSPKSRFASIATVLLIATVAVGQETSVRENMARQIPQFYIRPRTAASPEKRRAFQAEERRCSQGSHSCPNVGFARRPAKL